MDKKKEQEIPVRRGNKKLLIVGVVFLAIVLVVALLVMLNTPNRSVAAYCQTYKEEKARLAKLPGDSWPSGVFNDEVGDAGEFAKSFAKLEKVAPAEIQGGITTLKSAYQKIHDDPSQAISASLSGSSADDSVKKWTQERCSPGQ